MRLVISGLIAGLLLVSATGSVEAAGWKAGLAKADITPKQPMWLAGYGGRDHPSEGILHPIWIKALALEDAQGYKVVLLTTDLCGLPKWMYDNLCESLKKRQGLGREQIRITNSHNHCAPAVRGDLEDYYPLDEEQRKRVYDYSDWLAQQMLQTMEEALTRLHPVTLSAGEGLCTFAVNRRNNKEAEIPALLARGETPKGPVDHSVPVLQVKTPEGQTEAIVFGYACHNTVLSFYQWCGDYAGFAQIALEKKYPGSQAMFVDGCGGDQNPLPRRTVELAEKYGSQLAESVIQSLQKPLRPLMPKIRAAFEFVDLPFERNPTRAELEAHAQNGSPVRKRWAVRMLKKLDAGETFAKSAPFAIQAWSLGDQLWIALGGESLVGYSLRFKQEYGPNTWVTSYFADLTAYIPTRKNWDEGGYEVAFLHEYMLPADKWAPDVEERIAAGVARLVKAVKPE
ncbi:MAG: hypothetical protein U0903_01555 [Planctomycetales bacterium]